MYYPPNPPYMPYQNPLPNYSIIWEEKRDLRKVSLWVCVTVMAVLICFWLFPPVLLSFFHTIRSASYGESYYGFSPLLYQLFSCVIYLFCVGIPALIYFSSRQTSLNDALPFEHIRLRVAAPVILFGFGLCLLSNFPAGLVTRVEASAGFDINTPPPYFQNSIAAQAVYFVSMAIIPPIVEEVLFRGAALHALRRFGDKFAIIGSAFLFGLFHGDFAQFVFAFLCGIVMAFLVVKTNCLWISLAIHFLNNALATCMDLLAYYYGSDLSNVVFNISVLIVIMLALISAVLLVIFKKGFFHITPQVSPLRISQKFGSLLGNFGGVAVLILSIIQACSRLAS